jgi:hypothetical protein
VTRDERGRVLMVPVRLMGVVVMWLGAVTLTTWDTFGGPTAAGNWGLLTSAGAAAWSVLYGLARQQEHHGREMRNAFELGQEVGHEVQRIR